MLVLSLSSFAAECSDTDRWDPDAARWEERIQVEGPSPVVTEAAGASLRLACVDHLLRPGELADAYLVAAVGANLARRPADVERFLGIAARTAGGADLPHLAGSVLKGAFEDAVSTAAPAQVHAEVTTFIDGVPLPPGTSRSVPAGAHVVQYVGDAGLVTEVVPVTGADPVRVGPPAPPPPPPPPRTNKALGVVLLGVGGAALGGAIQLSNAAGLGSESAAIGTYASAAVGVGALVAGAAILTPFATPTGGGGAVFHTSF